MYLMKVKNATPKRYRTNFIEPGPADYTAEGFGIVLVLKDALDKMLPSFVGKPVFLSHKDVSPEEAFRNNGDTILADGVVSDVGYNEETGWYWADLIVWDQETQDKIDNEGYSVSCAYDVGDADGKGGTYHNIQFDQEVFDGEYTHMGIVDNPRYEDANILRNSKRGEKMAKRFFKFLGKKDQVENEAPEPEEKEEMVNEDTMIEIDGEQVPLSALKEAYKEENAQSQVMNEDDEIDVDGKPVRVGDMVNAYRNKKSCDVQNAEPAQDTPAEEVVDETKQLSNAKTESNENFKKIQNAVQLEQAPSKPVLNTRDERLAKGRERYSSKKGDK